MHRALESARRTHSRERNTWRGRGLSKSFISRVIIGVTPFRVLLALLITYLRSPPPLKARYVNGFTQGAAQGSRLYVGEGCGALVSTKIPWEVSG